MAWRRSRTTKIAFPLSVPPGSYTITTPGREDIALGSVGDTTITRHVPYLDPPHHIYWLRDYISDTSYILTEIEPSLLRPSVTTTVEDLYQWPLPTLYTYMQSSTHRFAINAGGDTLSSGDESLWGLLISNGQVLYENPHYTWILGIKTDGTLVAYEPNTPSSTILQDGCDNAVNGFVPIIIDGENVDDQTIAAGTPGHAFERHPRQVIGQRADGVYLILTCSGRTENEEGMTMHDCQRIMRKFGATFAYNLDGGGSTWTVANTRWGGTQNVSGTIFLTTRGVRTIIVFDDIQP